MKIKKLKPNRNNIETYLPIFNGFYGSYWSEPDFYGEAEHYGLPDDFDFPAFLNWTDYYNALSNYFCNCVESEMSEFIEVIEFQRLNSPKEYNFTNDSIYCIIRPKKKAITDYIYKHQTQFAKYLETHLKSRSGFISWHSYNFETWEKNTKKFKAWDLEVDPKGFNLGFVLSFIADNEELDETRVFEEANSHVYTSEYLSQDFYDLVKDIEENEFINRDNLIDAKQSGWKVVNLIEYIELIKKFVRGNYEYQNVADLAFREFSDLETGLSTLEDYIHIKKVINHQITEIESHTLKFEL